jgi:uncharacterized protein YndB with AHSA1/START domain
MPAVLNVVPLSDRELVLGRIIDAAPDKVFRCWTEPELMVQWLTPPPWKTIKAEVDLRPGGANLIVMQGPDGTQVPNHGVYLEIVPNQRIIMTDAFTRAWQPSNKAFMLTNLSFSPEGEGKTRYIARISHWSKEDKTMHENMGFHGGWGVATEQLEALAKSL